MCTRSCKCPDCTWSHCTFHKIAEFLACRRNSVVLAGVRLVLFFFALLHRSACFPFLSVFTISGCFGASLILLAIAVFFQLCCSAVYFIFAGRLGCQQPSWLPASSPFPLPFLPYSWVFSLLFLVFPPFPDVILSCLVNEPETNRKFMFPWPAKKLASKLHLHSIIIVDQLCCQTCSCQTRTFHNYIINYHRSRFQVKPATLLVPIELILFLSGEEVYGTWYQRGSFSLMWGVVFAACCLRSYFLFCLARNTKISPNGHGSLNSITNLLS